MGVVRHRLVLSAFALLAAAHLIAAQVTEQLGSFRSSIELVSLQVTVTDQSARCFSRSPPYWNSGWDGCPVTGLTKDAFKIFEDGVEQQIEIFQSSEVPIAVSLVIDIRSIDRVRTSDVHNAAIGVVRKLRPHDLAEVVGFKGNHDIHQVLTSDRVMLERAIRATRPLLIDPALNPIDPLRRKLESAPTAFPNAIRRQAIVFVTDREDIPRGVNLGVTANLAKRSQAVIYTIAIVDKTALDSSNERTSALRQLATLTGGRAFFPEDVRSLPSLYNQISDEISQQYTIGYTSNNQQQNGGWRLVEVRVTRPDTSARTKQGYFAPIDP